MPTWTRVVQSKVQNSMLGDINISASDYYISHLMQLLQYCIKKFEATIMLFEGLKGQLKWKIHE